MPESETDNNTLYMRNTSLMESQLLGDNIRKMSRDMSFFSIVYMISGVLASMTLIGAIVGIPMVIYHYKLREAGKAFERFLRTNDFDHLNRAINQQRQYFLFYKILIIASILFVLLNLAVLIYLLSTGMSVLPQHFA